MSPKAIQYLIKLILNEIAEIISAALIVIIFVVFAVQNFENVTINLFKWGVTLTLACTTIAVYVLGMSTGCLLWSNLKKLTMHEDDTKAKHE